MDSTELRFPEGFLWGAATAAYQIEGAAGRGRQGPVDLGHVQPHPGEDLPRGHRRRGADSYHRYPEDIEMLKRLGVGAYRFSLSWPRIQPDGRGAANSKGLDYYNRVVDALLEAGIDPGPSRSTTGTCRRRCRTPAAGRTGTSRRRSPSTRGSRARRSATGCAGGSR